MRRVLLLVAMFTLLAVAAPVLAQDAFELTSPNEEDALQSGGDGGTQFPDGTSNCSGDRQHHAHGAPNNPCVLKNNPRYATDMGGGEVCSKRAKLCSSCLGCCGMQKTEAERCHCDTNHCFAMLDYVEQKCRDNCNGSSQGTGASSV